MMQIFSQSTKLSLSQLSLILFSLRSLKFSNFVKLLSKLLIFAFKCLQLLLPEVEIVDIFPHIKPSKNSLNVDGLPGKILKILFILIFKLSNFEHLPSIEGTEESLDFDSSRLLSEELFSLDEHSKYGLDFESSRIVPIPILLSLISAEVVVLG